MAPQSGAGSLLWGKSYSWLGAQRPPQHTPDLGYFLPRTKWALLLILEWHELPPSPVFWRHKLVPVLKIHATYQQLTSHARSPPSTWFSACTEINKIINKAVHKHPHGWASSGSVRTAPLGEHCLIPGRKMTFSGKPCPPPPLSTLLNFKCFRNPSCAEQPSRAPFYKNGTSPPALQCITPAMPPFALY